MIISVPNLNLGEETDAAIGAFLSAQPKKGHGLEVLNRGKAAELDPSEREAVEKSFGAAFHQDSVKLIQILRLHREVNLSLFRPDDLYWQSKDALEFVLPSERITPTRTGQILEKLAG